VVDGDHLVATQAPVTDEGIRARHAHAMVPSVRAQPRQVLPVGFLGVFQVSEDQAGVGVQREHGLRAQRRHHRVQRVCAVRGRGINLQVVDRHRVVRHDELHVRVSRRDDLPNALGPHRAVHHPQGLHLHHQFDLVERSVARADPVQALGRTQLLRGHVLEEVLERLVDLDGFALREGAHRLRALVVDGTEQVLLDVVVDDGAEVRGVEVVLHETVFGAPFVQRRAGHLPTVGQRVAVRIAVQVEETRLARSEESTLVPLWNVVVVPGLLVGHPLTWVVRSVYCARPVSPIGRQNFLRRARKHPFLK